VTMGFAWERNPGGAIHALDAGGARVVHWAPWLLLGATRFLPVFVSVCAVAALLRALIAHVLERRRA